MKIYLSSLILLLAFSHNIFPQDRSVDLSGTYYHINNREIPSKTHNILNQLILKEDSSFIYLRTIELHQKHSSGDWHVKNNVIHLQSDIQNLDSLDLLVKESYNPNLKNLRVNLKGKNNEDLLLAYVEFNNNNELKYASLGSIDTCTFNLKEGIKLYSFKVYHEVGVSMEYSIKNPKSNQFDIILGASNDLGRYEIIKDERVEIHDSYLKFRGANYYLAEKDALIDKDR